MYKRTIAVIFGGCSPEYEVSLKSAHSIINALNPEKYNVILIGITRQGEWYRFSGDVSDIISDKWHTDSGLLKKMIISPSRGEGLLEFDDNDCASKISVDAVFPVLHGRYGEDGTIQGLCELAGIPVIGSGAAASALCMDKHRAYKIVSGAGIKVPKSVCYVTLPTEEELLADTKDMKLPLFVKPVKAGSSIGMTKIDEHSQLQSAVKFAFEFDDAVLVEEGVVGFEIGFAVVGNTELVVGRPDEVEVAKGFFDYEEKYSLKTAKLHMPARIDAQTEKRLGEAAKKIYYELGCRGYARVDLFLSTENEIIFNETNTIPGFTQHSRFPKMMNAIGVGFEELVDTLVKLGTNDE